jgi:hypothetical protein
MISGHGAPFKLMNEDLKKYLPWIIGAVVVILILRKVMGGGAQTTPTIVPQTQLTQTPQTDPLAALRGSGFQQLAQFGLGAIQAESAAQTAAIQAQAQTSLAQTEAQLQNQLQNRTLDTQLQQTQLITDAQAQAAYNQNAQQNYNTQQQNAAISAYYNAVNQRNILGSINNALGTIFGGGGFGSGNIFTTPPICC